jgi:hypothetical protein
MPLTGYTVRFSMATQDATGERTTPVRLLCFDFPPQISFRVLLRDSGRRDPVITISKMLHRCARMCTAISCVRRRDRSAIPYYLVDGVFASIERPFRLTCTQVQISILYTGVVLFDICTIVYEFPRPLCECLGSVYLFSN